MVHSLHYRQTIALPANNSAVAVTLDTPFDDTEYTIEVECPYMTRHWISDKAADSFVLNVETTNVAEKTFGLIIFHE